MIDLFMPLVNRFFILDNISTDDTLTIIQDEIFNEHMPIVHFEQPFENFVYSKNFILNKAYTYLRNYQDKKQVIIFVNADEFLQNDEWQLWKQKLQTIQLDQIFNVNIEKLNANGSHNSVWNDNRIWVYNPQKPLFFNGPFVYEYLDTQDYQIVKTDLTLQCQLNLNKDKNVELDLHIDLLNKYIQMSNNQDPNWMRAIFYLGQTYKNKGVSEKAIESWETYLINYDTNRYNNSSERFFVAYCIAQEYFNKEFYQFAIKWILKSINEYQDTTCFRREPYVILYSIYFQQYWDNKKELQKIIDNIDVVINAESNPQSTTMYFDTQAVNYLEEIKKQVIQRISQLNV